MVPAPHVRFGVWLGGSVGYADRVMNPGLSTAGNVAGGGSGARTVEDRRMPVPPSASHASPRSTDRRSKLGSLIGPTGTGLAGLLFVVVLLLVVSGWSPLQRLDASVVDASNALVGDRPWAVTGLHLITNLGGTEAAWLLLPVTVIWLLIRRLYGLAAYVAARVSARVR